MQSIRSILVVLLEDPADDLALRRARRIAGVTGSELHLLQGAATEAQRHALDAQAEVLRNEGHRVTVCQTHEPLTHRMIITAQQEEGCGLVVKQHQPDSLLTRALLTPEDWRLLRHCPAPVLLVKNDRSWKGGKVLAAVDVGNSDQEHLAVHDEIVSHACDLARIVEGELHVLTAHPAPLLTASDPVFQHSESIAAHYRQACQQFQDEYGFSNQQLHVAEGSANLLIPQMATQLDAVVTVIGTVARSGLSGALIGNTAEAVLDTLESDVLVLKPEAIIQRLEAMLEQR